MRLLCCFLLIVATACRKEFLNASPDESRAVPVEVADFQRILDNDAVMNGYGGQSGSPNLTEMSSDNYYVSNTTFSQLSSYYQGACTWSRVLHSGTAEINDWDLSYRRADYANIALAGLAKLGNNVKGQPPYQTAVGCALFFRSVAFFELAQVFSPPFDEHTADTTWGIPLRLSDQVDEPIFRSSVRQTYNRITGDLRLAAALLSSGTPPVPTRPSRKAAFGMLARVYLSMEKYDSAYRYADSCLHLQSALLDLSTLPTNTLNPFTRFNPEVIFAEVMQQVDISAVTPAAVPVDSNLYRSYAAGDLRRVLFFKPAGGGAMYFLGFFDEQNFAACSLTTAEMYLVRSECLVRAGNIDDALQDLDTLLSSRWTKGTFTNVTATGRDDALQKILAERRKELVFRGLRWSDLRRLNRDPLFRKTLFRRTRAGIDSLPPGDHRYTLPIPDNIMAFHPGMPQNPRQ